MKKLYQTKFGAEDGNCFETCLAMLLGCSVEDIPSFKSNQGHWAQLCNDFLATKGLCFVEFSIKDQEAGYWKMKSGYSIISGKSPRLEGIQHSVVGFRGEYFHDPHPDNAYLKEPESIGFLCLRCENEISKV